MNALNPLNWFRPKNATLKEPEWWRQEILQGSSSSGVYVSEGAALKLSAVYSCIRVLAETMAGLPAATYARTSKGKEWVEHPLNNLFGSSPNSYQTAFELIESNMVSLGLGGTSYNQKVIDGRGRVAEIIPLQHQYIQVEQHNGKLLFDYQAPGEARHFTSEQIWKVSGLSCNGVTGLSPIGLARESLGIAAASEMSAARMYSNGAQIPGVLEYPGSLSDDELIKRLRNQWNENQSGVGNAHKPLILEAGMKYNQIGMTSKDAQFLEARKFQISEIARWYRVPLHKLGELDRATFSNIEHQSIEFVTDTILPWARRFEQSIGRDLLTETERSKLFFRFTLDGLLRGDTKSRYEAHASGINSGWLSRNEVRELENKNPVDGLDDYLVPLNMSGNQEQNRVANFLATREINALNNSSNENPSSWAADFYQRHAETMKELTGLCPKECAKYAAQRIKLVETLGIKEAKATAIEKTQETLCQTS